MESAVGYARDICFAFEEYKAENTRLLVFEKI